MLKSLFSGVSGLQSHQIAMDVESNNIANVNTVGFKYSRANFSDLLAQTRQIATAPQGGLGGKNAVQIGLGTQIDSTTRIFSQGSIQNTDKNTDIAIQGDGFFIVTGDEGNTLKYTRSGDFKFDAVGNFVDNNGFIALGWRRDEEKNKIDNTAPIRPINIPPGLTTPAEASNEVKLKANLNSSDLVKNKSLMYDTVAINEGLGVSDDLGVLHNANGKAFSLQPAVLKDGGIIEGGQGFQLGTGGEGTAVFGNFRYTRNPNLLDIQDADGNGVYYFNSTTDLATAMQHWISTNPLNTALSPTAEVTIEEGKFKLSNQETETSVPLLLKVKPLLDEKTTENIYFTQSMRSLEGTLKLDGKRISQTMYVPTHSSSIDVFDSLGSKHTLQIKFRKNGSTKDGGTAWNYDLIVPEPGDLDGLGNIIRNNQIVFNNDGSISSNSRTRFYFSPNNGSAPDQEVTISFGIADSFEGITSFDAESATSSISQNGYSGGDLVGIRIDQSGTLMGSFSNGRSFGLAQLSMAKFANNEGLVNDGGNVFDRSANSGDAVIGTAATGGRGFIQSSALEASNVDLSRSLTQLIIIQRGFQANSKTITTSDQLLNTLIQLKN